MLSGDLALTVNIRHKGEMLRLWNRLVKMRKKQLDSLLLLRRTQLVCCVIWRKLKLRLILLVYCPYTIGCCKTSIIF